MHLQQCPCHSQMLYLSRIRPKDDRKRQSPPMAIAQRQHSSLVFPPSTMLIADILAARHPAIGSSFVCQARRMTSNQRSTAMTRTNRLVMSHGPFTNQTLFSWGSCKSHVCQVLVVRSRPTDTIEYLAFKQNWPYCRVSHTEAS